MTRCVSLFRGINVGGHHTVSMSELKALHLSLGFTDVATYIQSGNVVFTCADDESSRVAQQIETAFADKFGFRSQVIVRTAEELHTLIERNPFRDQETKDPKWIVVLFLAGHAVSAAQEELRTAYTGPEDFFVVGQEMYVYYTDGIGRSKLTVALIEKKLGTTCTGRNLNTVLQLQKML